MLRRLDVAETNVVVRRGRPGDCMYFIASGEVEVQLKPHPIRLGAGAFFGEIALLQGGPRTATLMTTRPSTLLILELSDFRAFTALSSGVGARRRAGGRSPHEQKRRCARDGQEAGR